MSADEEQWQRRLSDYRAVELHALRTASLFNAGLFALTTLDPLLLSAVSLTVYALSYGTLQPSVAFTAMSLFASLELSLGILPDFFTKWFEARISSGRINQFLNEPEKEDITLPGTSIIFDNAAIRWPNGTANDEDDAFVLRGLQLEFPMGKLSVISGKTGSGKSLLLQAILGECDLLEGTIYVPSCSSSSSSAASSDDWITPSTIAYVAQIPWIENATLKENILFGLPYDSNRYRTVLSACALIPDLALLDGGDLTEVGANGINLSGGQRWRLSLARALYSRAEILIIDDIFSALDTQTSSHVYRHALTGAICRGRTRILVTHHIDLCLPGTNYLVYLENMTVKRAGEPTAVERTVKGAQSPKTSNGARRDTNEQVDGQMSPPAASARKTQMRFGPDEERVTGSTKFRVYKSYFARGGLFLWGLAVILYASYTTLIFGRSWWIKAWTDSSSQKLPKETSPRYITRRAALATDGDSVFFYLRTYVFLSAIACLLGLARYFGIVFAALRASRRLYDELVFVIIRAPLHYLDAVPLGRLLNLFSADFSLIDSKMGQDAGFVLGKGLELIAIVVAGVSISPTLVLIGAVVIYFCKRLSAVYLAGAREVRRLESISRGAVYDHFTCNLSGLVTIRAFRRADYYVQCVYNKVDRYTRASWNLWLFNRWLSLRMNISGAIFSTLTAAFVVYMPQIPAGLAGFALSFALQYSSAITQFLRQTANFELDMNAIERVLFYMDTEIEPQGGKSVPASWPTEGQIEFRSLVTGYNSDGPPVLKGLDFHVRPHERIGIVGRTGAGKSSLALALFRFLAIPEGTVYVDGVDVSKIKLRDLRSRLTMIPQDPVLFSGTIRSNLDPLHEHTDTELYHALQRVGLTVQISREEPPSGPVNVATRANTPTETETRSILSLTTPISERGLNLSQGQRQLLCLARAIISRPKVIVIDEGTSAVDMATDRKVQRLIHDEFKTSTLLVIAHRLSTVADFSRILVLDKGKVVEFATPKQLMQVENGYFRALVEASGERDAINEVIFG
ncbi:hypothetical protein HFD88_005733 [Aspergillus terreus]|nr:hypothetical protein HFD88_005733 [Aspergillus terreus]